METHTTTLDYPSVDVAYSDLDFDSTDVDSAFDHIGNLDDTPKIPDRGFDDLTIAYDSELPASFSPNFENMDDNTPRQHNNLLADESDAISSSENELTNSSEIDFDAKDDKPQTQTYVIAEDGKIFPEDKVDKPEERLNYELELKTEEQRQALSEIQDSSEKSVEIKILFSTETDNQGRIVKSYSVQTYTPRGEDENGRTRFELSSDIEIEIIEDDVSENEDTERAEPLPAAGSGDSPQATEQDNLEDASSVSVHDADDSIEPENTTLSAKPTSSHPGIDDQASPEYNENLSDNNPWSQDSSSDDHNKPTNPTTPAPEDLPQGDNPNEAPPSIDTEHFANKNPTITTAENDNKYNQENITASTDEKPTVIAKENPSPPQTEQTQEPLLDIPEVQSTTSSNDAQTKATTTKPQIKAARPLKAKPVVNYSTRENASQITPKSNEVPTTVEPQVNQPAEIIQNTKHNSEISQAETKTPEASTVDSPAPSLDADTSDQSTETTIHQNSISEQTTEHPKVTEVAPLSQQNSSPLKPEAPQAPAEATRETSTNNIEAPSNSNKNHQATKMTPEVSKQSNIYEQRSGRQTYKSSVYKDFVVEITTPTINRTTAETQPPNKEKAQSAPEFTVTFENPNDSQNRVATPTASAFQTQINDHSAKNRGDLEFTIPSIPRGNKTKPSRQTFKPIGAVA